MIALIDYGMGNLRSVEKALTRAGAEVQIVSGPDPLAHAAALVLPGVGAFGDCMANLNRLGFIDPIRNFIASGRPFLGICLGMQELFDSSEESPGVHGLGLFAGTVPRFHLDAKRWKVPHMGWNELRIQRADCPLLSQVPDRSYVYFVHSYFCAPRDKALTCATTEYGAPFCSMLWSHNVFATQFHPEKSQGIGLQILRNFVTLTDANS